MDSNFSSIELLGDVIGPDSCDQLHEFLVWLADRIAEKRASILRYAKEYEPSIDLKAGHNWNDAEKCWCQPRI